jgi:hypothetical protein
MSIAKPLLVALLFFPAAAATAAPAAPTLTGGRQIAPGADRACLRALDKRRILFVALGPVRGVRTPVVIAGPIRGVTLEPRAGRPPVMDCALAHALTDLTPLLRKLRVTALSYSGAYDYRTRARSSKLSEHARGLAIDVHGLETAAGTLEIARDYPRDAGRWRAAAPGPGALARCLGRPARAGGKLLRTLACRLKLDPRFRVVLTPDDNADHRDHLHIETSPREKAGPPVAYSRITRRFPDS